MFRFKSNCRVTLEDPRLLDEVISETAAMRPNWRSSGVATEDAIISGLAPGNPADTETVGKSTWGSGDTGSKRNATAPASEMATTISVVAIGLRMKGSEIFMTYPAGTGSDPGGVAGPPENRLARRSNQR